MSRQRAPATCSSDFDHRAAAMCLSGPSPGVRLGVLDSELVPNAAQPEISHPSRFIPEAVCISEHEYVYLLRPESRQSLCCAPARVASRPRNRRVRIGDFDALPAAYARESRLAIHGPKAHPTSRFRSMMRRPPEPKVAGSNPCVAREVTTATCGFDIGDAGTAFGAATRWVAGRFMAAAASSSTLAER
jgi:hypothetical protein